MRALISFSLISSCLLLACAEDAPPFTSSGGHQGGAGAAGGAGGAGTGGAAGGQGGAVGGQGGAGGNQGQEGPPATITKSGAADKILLLGQLITPDKTFAGEVLIEGDLITCAAASCSGEAGAAAATVVQTNGIIMPGMIDSHNHILFNIFDEQDWAPSKVYDNHDQWPREARYSAMIDAKQYLNGEAGSPVNVNCEMNKYGEIKGLIAGTTSIVGGANPGNKLCYRTLARTIDQTANGLCGTVPPQSCEDNIQVNTLFPKPVDADKICVNFSKPVKPTNAYIIHIAEGVDDTARDEFSDLNLVTTTDGCLLAPQTTIVHGTALREAQFDTMQANGMSLSWSPQSNVFLYGGGTDFTKTTNIPLALSKGITVALSPDWSLGGSQNLLDELRFADKLDNQEWSNILSPQKLTEMVTRDAAKVLALDGQIGALEAGMKADVVVFGGDQSRPYEALLAASPREIRLVIVDGVPLYGDDQLEPLGPTDPGCESMDVCQRDKFICVAINGGRPQDKWGQTLSELTAAIATELSQYDDQDVTQWDFSPLTPLVKCN